MAVQSIDTMPLSFLYQRVLSLGVFDEELGNIRMDFLIIQWREHRITRIKHMAGNAISLKSIMPCERQYTEYLLI